MPYLPDISSILLQIVLESYWLVYNYTAGDVVTGHGVWYMALIKALGASDVNVTSRLTVFDDPNSKESKVGLQNLVSQH